MKIILLGVQGSGKSTQGNLLSSHFQVPYLSTGHIFRSLAEEDSPLGHEIKELMTKGYLIPDDKTLEIVTDYLSRPEYQNGFILDGYPRNLSQAESFPAQIDKVVYVDVSDEEARRRIEGRNTDKAKRPDDTPEAITRRIGIFHEFTKPLLEYYKNKGILIEVNGEQAVEDIQKEILKRLEK
jgi:adenylate kinase